MGEATGKRSAELVGREPLLALIREQLVQIRSHGLRVVLLSGEPGIGKSRVLEAMAEEAVRQGLSVLAGGASDAVGMPPYLPFLEALGSYVRNAPLDLLREQVGGAASILATILLELTLRLGEMPPGYPLPAEQSRLRLYEAVGELLAAIGSRNGLLLVLDDLHWADPATLDLLCYVARHQSGAQVLILGAYRAGETTDNPPFQRALLELNRLRLLVNSPLEPFSAVDVAEFASAYLDMPVDANVVRVLHVQSEGNPFFAEELLRGWLEAGVLVGGDGGWSLAAPDGQEMPPPPAGLVGAVRQRLARLSPEVTDLLRSASIIGKSFDVELLAEVSGQEDADLVEECLLEAVRTHLLRASGPGTYTFGHDKIREALYDEVTSVRRRRLHGFIGRALEARNEPEGAQTQLAAPQHLAELAFHFARSGDRARGAMYARQAAEQALSTYAPEDAIAHYRAALGFADTSDAQRGELLLGLGNAALLANSHAEAVAAFEAAQSWYERAGENEGAARAAHRLGNAWWQQEAIPQARIAFETAVALFAGRPIPESVTALVDLSSLLTLSLNQHDEGRKYAKQALELALQIGDERLIASARRALGNLMVRAGDLEGGKAVLVEALDLAAIADDPAEAAECCACLTMASTWSGNFKHAVDYAQRQIEFARRCHAHYLLRHVYTHLALFYFYQGRLDQAEQMAAEEQLVLGRSGNTEAQAYLDIVKSLLAAQGRGQFAEGLQLAEGALTAWRGLNSNSVVWHLGNLAVLQAVAEKRDDALALLDELEATMAVLPPGSAPFIMVLDQMATTGLLLGERERERLFRFYPMLASFRGRIGNSIIDRLLGEIETLQGDFAGAQVSLAAAEAIARREDIVWELALVLVARANLALAVKGEKSTETARALLVEGLDLFDKYGSTPISERVRDTLRTLNGPRRGSAKERPALPSGLSVREAEVLRHVAAGRTNREIAEELVLSEKTVNNHLERIFAKIGANNRAAASAFAVRHNLAK